MYRLKLILIKEIKNIIEKYGSFSIGEIDTDHSPIFYSIGDIIFLGETFYKDVVEVIAYHKDREIDWSTQLYEKFSLKNIKLILELAKEYKKTQENEE